MAQPMPIQFYIVMPVYKTEAFVEQSVRSVLAQTYPHFHLIMVDDGSPDNSGRICDALVTEDARLSVIHRQNGGQLAARNTAIAEAKRLCEQPENAYVVFLDSDDWLETHALHTIADQLTQTDCDCLIYGFRRVMGEIAVYRTAEEPHHHVFSVTEACKKICIDTTYNSLCRKAIRLSQIPLLECSAYHHLRLGEDLLQTLDILYNLQTVVFITDHLYNYRVNPDSVTESINYTTSFDFEYTVEQRLLAFLREQSVHDENGWAVQWKMLSERLYSDIMKLLFSHHDWKQKRMWLERIRSCTYVQTELAPRISYAVLPKNKQFVLKHFIKRQYRLLHLYYIISKLRK